MLEVLWWSRISSNHIRQAFNFLFRLRWSLFIFAFNHFQCPIFVLLKPISLFLPFTFRRSSIFIRISFSYFIIFYSHSVVTCLILLLAEESHGIQYGDHLSAWIVIEGQGEVRLRLYSQSIWFSNISISSFLLFSVSISLCRPSTGRIP